LSCCKERQRGSYPGAGPNQGRAGATTPAGAVAIREGSAAAPSKREGATAPGPGYPAVGKKSARYKFHFFPTAPNAVCFYISADIWNTSACKRLLFIKVKQFKSHSSANLE